MKKKMLLFCVLLIVFVSSQAQISLPESYYVNKAKAQLKAASDKKGREPVVVAVKDGCLYYVIRDGAKTDYVVERKEQYIVYAPYRYEQSISLLRKNRNDFAELLQSLYKDKFYLTNIAATQTGLEMYFFEKQW